MSFLDGVGERCPHFGGIAVKSLLFFTTSLFFFISCGIKPGGEEKLRSLKTTYSSDQKCVNKPNVSLAESIPTYYGTVKAIIDTKCAWCHSATAAIGDRHSPYLTSYTLVKSNASSSIQHMQAGDMPPPNKQPQLATGDLDAVIAWKNNGYLQGTQPPPIDANQPVYYVNTIKNILTSSCVGCHAAGGYAPNLTSYDGTKASGAAVLADINAGTMPKSGPLPTDQKTAFQNWANAGYPYDAAGTTPPPPAPEPTPAPAPSVDVSSGIVYYKDAIGPLLERKCVNCHGVGGTIPEMADYDSTKTNAALIIAAINAGTMPPAGPLPADEKNWFKLWADGGYLYDSAGTKAPKAKAKENCAQ